MPRKTCINCNCEKRLDEFVSDRRYHNGRTNQCKECNNAKGKVKVECDVCSKLIATRGLAKHKKSLKCEPNREAQPWEHFKSNGTKKIKCPCEHELCKGTVTEATVYRHLKYLTTGVTVRKRNKYPVMEIDSESEREL